MYNAINLLYLSINCTLGNLHWNISLHGFASWKHQFRFVFLLLSLYLGLDLDVVKHWATAKLLLMQNMPFYRQMCIHSYFWNAEDHVSASSDGRPRNGVGAKPWSSAAVVSSAGGSITDVDDVIGALAMNDSSWRSWEWPVVSLQPAMELYLVI